MEASSSESSLLKMKSVNSYYKSEESKFEFDINSEETKRKLSIPSQTNTIQGDSKLIKLDELTKEPMELDNQEQQQTQIQQPPKK
jgi:hypothetical protein